jgi:hypothetical protein
MDRLLRLGTLAALFATMACSPSAGAMRVETAAAPSPPTSAQPASPTVRVSGAPAPAPGTPSQAVSPSPSASPETPEEAVTLEPASPAPSAPNVTVTAVDERAWVERLRADFGAQAIAGPAAVALNREAAGPVTNAIGFNVPTSHEPTGFLWNEGDRGVDEWYPQGIGGVEQGGRRWLLVSWYAKDAKEGTTDPAMALSYRGARLSLVDVTDPARISYRHLLLVQDAANIPAKGLFRMGAVARAGYRQGERFAPVPIHAGGLEVYQNWVYVVDTQLGVRVFDLNQMLKAEADEAKSTCGLVGGKLVAFDYRYVLPQVAHYRIQGAAPYSCLSLDRPSMTLWLGQYLAPTDSSRSAITGVPLGLDGRLGDRATSVTFPKDKGGAYAHRIQGAFRQGNKTWLSITGQTRYEGSTARLALYEDGAASGYRWRWPHGAEDLYYDETQDRLWCLTEFPDSVITRRDRCVFGVTLGTYRTP